MRKFVKKIVKKILNVFGYDVIKREDNTNMPILIGNFKNACSVYEYLFSKDFPGTIKKDEKRLDIMQRLLGTPPSEAYFIVNLLEKTKHVIGDVCEFGVAQGETSCLIANEIKLSKKLLHLFDSFEGLPKPTKKDQLKNDIFNLGSMAAYEGTMRCPEQMVIRRLNDIKFPGKQYFIHKGYIEKLILKKENFPKKVSFAYIDFDFYEPIKIALEYLNMSTEKGAVIMIDDYDFFSTGVKSAVDEFISKNNEISRKYELFIPEKVFGYFAILTKLQ